MNSILLFVGLGIILVFIVIGIIITRWKTVKVQPTITREAHNVSPLRYSQVVLSRNLEKFTLLLTLINEPKTAAKITIYKEDGLQTWYVFHDSPGSINGDNFNLYLKNSWRKDPEAKFGQALINPPFEMLIGFLAANEINGNWKLARYIDPEHRASIAIPKGNDN